MKHREPTRLIRVRMSVYSSIKILSAVKHKPMTNLLTELVTPELRRHGFEVEKIAGKVLTPAESSSDVPSNK